jgi:acyl-CoA hydrolase
MCIPNLIEYQDKTISPRQAAALVRSGMRIHLGGSANVATIMDKYLAQRTGELTGVFVQTYIDTVNYKICEADPDGEAFLWHSAFIASPMRSVSAERGIGVYIPEAWHTAPMVYRKHLHFDIFYLVTAPMDEEGYFNFGLTVGHTMAIADVADRVVVIVRKDMPVVCGGCEERIHVTQIDYIVEDDEFETYCLPSSEPTIEDKEIARHIIEAGLIRDGSTLQIGIGGLPNAVLESLKASGMKHCGLHTEMFTEGMLDLIELGIVDNSQKKLDRFKSVFTFSLGSRRLYDHLDHNPSLAAYPVDYTNHPFIISQQPKMFSLNSGAQIDLTGQVASEQLPGRSRPVQISGTGGQLDFVLGTLLSHDGEGVSVLSLYSRYRDRSRVVPLLETGANVTVPRSLVHYVATEWGIVNLKGLSNQDRALALISISHPDFREWLAKSAIDLGLVTYGRANRGHSAV